MNNEGERPGAEELGLGELGTEVEQPAEPVAAQQPEPLLPHHLGGEVPEVEQARTEGASAKELYEKRREALRQAPDMEGVLRNHLKEKNVEIPENQNLSLLAIREFQRYVKEAQDLRKVVKSSEGQEKLTAARLYNERVQKVQEYLTVGLPFEKAYREYIRAERQYFDFRTTLRQINVLQSSLTEPTFAHLSEDAQFDENAIARLESLSRHQTLGADITEEERESTIEALKTIYAEDSQEYKDAVAELTSEAKDQTSPHTKKEVVKEIEELRSQAQEAWESPLIRTFYHTAELESLMKNYAAGKDIIEMPSTIHHLNRLHEWEQLHQRTTIGGVLVGPPGVGKTTLVRHYLEEKGRKHVYMDLSEDVTRYLLYGSKSVDFKSPSEYYQRLAIDLKGLDDNQFREFIKEHSTSTSEVFGVTGDEAAVVLMGQLNEALEQGLGTEESEELKQQLEQARIHITGLADRAFRNELAHGLGHTVKKNGWRDGVIISALRRNESVIMDEFNKNKNWSLVYGLLTAKPGEKWYFADNDEHIEIPEDWKMYFTANIGRRHGVYQVAEALASRSGGKVLEVDYPPAREEMELSLVALSNPEGDFLRNEKDLSKLFVTVNELFPRIRNFIKDRNQAIPISFRTIRDLSEKLIVQKDKATGKSVFQPTNKSFDEALYEVLVESYSLYEDKEVPKELVNLATTTGIFLDENMRDRVSAWIGEEEFDKRQKQFAEHEEDFKAIGQKIRGMRADVAEDTLSGELPTGREF